MCGTFGTVALSTASPSLLTSTCMQVSDPLTGEHLKAEEVVHPPPTEQGRHWGFRAGSLN